MKTSEFPVGTVIDVVSKGLYEKTRNGDWLAAHNNTKDVIISESIDSYQVRIISVPYGVVWQMAMMLADEYGNFDGEGNAITLNSIIKDAVDRYQEEKVRSRIANDRKKSDEPTHAPTFKIDTLLLKTRMDAEDVLDALTKMIDTYGEASVQDLYDAVGLVSTFIDTKWVWTDLKEAKIIEVDGGYSFKFPTPKIR